MSGHTPWSEIKRETPLDLADLREKAEAAIPALWAWEGSMGGMRTDQIVVTSVTGFERVPPAEAAYIIAANPATILRLLNLLREVAAAGVVIDIPGKYVEVQIDHRTWAALTERSAT